MVNQASSEMMGGVSLHEPKMDQMGDLPCDFFDAPVDHRLWVILCL